MAVTPKGGYVGVLLGIAIAAGVTFAVASLLLGFGRLEKGDPDKVELADADAPAPVPAQAGAAQAETAKG
jgi:PTS system mannitol-specific IIC component